MFDTVLHEESLLALQGVVQRYKTSVVDSKCFLLQISLAMFLPEISRL